MLHEFVTCDMCNEDGDIDLNLIGSIDEGARFQVSGDEDRAKELGWDVDGDGMHYDHICPECLNKDDDDEGAVDG